MIVGLTGGMGSGKTTILKMFKELGAGVYIADLEAKKLMNESESLKRKIIEAFGKDSYKEGILNTVYLAKRVFSDTDNLKLMNSLVHPAVQEHFIDFVSKSKKKYVIFESAILFQSKILNICKFNIVVTAPLSVRLERIVKRDGLSMEEIERRLQHQNASKEMIAKADFVIENSDLDTAKKEVFKIHKVILMGN